MEDHGREVDVRENLRRAMPKQKPGRSKQDYGTPPEFLEATKKLLRIQEFDIDLASDDENKVAPWWYTEKQDALTKPWKMGTGWNWLNPPFARIEPWVQRAWEQWRAYNAKTPVLIPAGVGSNWWRKWVHRKARVLLLNGRITFVGAEDPYPKDCALLLYGSAPGYHVWDWQKETVYY